MSRPVSYGTTRFGEPASEYTGAFLPSMPVIRPNL